MGIENDFDIVISGDNVEAGLRVVNEPAEYIEQIGSAIMLSKTAAVEMPMFTIY